MRIALDRDEVPPPRERIRQEITRGAGPIDTHAAQLRRQMDETRAPMDAQLTQLAQRVSQMPAALLEQHVLGPVHGLQETVARATTWLHHYPWPVIVGLLVVAIALLYSFAPDVEQAWTWITPGSACVVPGWLLASLGFAFYVNHFGSYNATYGSIGAVIVLLTWMYVTGLFILIGGEINAAIEHAAPRGKEPGEKQLSGA